MPTDYQLTDSQIAALKALCEGVVELSTYEVAVAARLLPHRALWALGSLEQMGLTSSWVPITGKTGDRLHVSTDMGRNVYGALARFDRIPVGTRIQLPQRFTDRLIRQPVSWIEVIAEAEGEAA